MCVTWTGRSRYSIDGGSNGTWRGTRSVRPSPPIRFGTQSAVIARHAQVPGANTLPTRYVQSRRKGVDGLSLTCMAKTLPSVVDSPTKRALLAMTRKAPSHPNGISPSRSASRSARGTTSFVECASLWLLPCQALDRAQQLRCTPHSSLRRTHTGLHWPITACPAHVDCDQPANTIACRKTAGSASFYIAHSHRHAIALGEYS